MGGTLLRALLLAFVALAPGASVAQRYPSQAIRLVVPQAPGGQADAIGRAVGLKLGELLQQPVVILNHGGAGGTIGAEMVAKAPADGYTLLLGGSNNLALAVALRPDLPYDPLRSFVPIRAVARVAYALAVNPKLPVATVAELVAYARARPGRLNYGSSGTGSTSSLGAEMLKSAASIDIVHVPYNGSAPAVAAVVAGQIDMIFADLSLLLPQARAGALRLVAAAGARRAMAAPDLPTVAEQGIPGFDLDAWYGIVAPAGTPEEVAATLRDALSAMLRSPEFRQRLERLGYDPVEDDAKGLAATIRSDIDRYGALVKRANIRAAP
jgi:tripartite-type tricarboxylate transporter receptor subunit TctC